MKLVVGLGNPGYDNTRHNTGFMVIDNIVKKLNLTSKEKFNGEYYEYAAGEKIVFLKPLSYMNLSGEVVKKYIDYFKIDLSDILIIFDDMDMELGKIRLREKGSSGGHNGIKNITSNIGTEEFKRVKIGIGTKKNSIKHVLGRFNKKEKEVINESIEIVSDICLEFDKTSFKELMNKYNGER